MRSAQRERHLLVPARPGGRLAGSHRRARPSGPEGFEGSEVAQQPRSPRRLQVRLAPSHVSVPEAETEKKTRFIPSSTAILYFPKSHFYSNILLPLGEYLLSGILVLFFFIFVLFFVFVFVFLLFFSSHFFDYCLYLGKPTSMVLSLFLNQVFLACDGSLDKALCLGVRGRGARCERLPSPAKCATGFMEKAL